MRFEGPGAFAGQHRARAPAREPHHRARRRRRVAAAPPQQAHRLRDVLRAHPERGERAQPRAPAWAWRSSSDGATLYVAGLRLEQGRRVRHRAARERHVRARHRRDQIARQRRRPDRPRARRGGATASTCSRASTTRSRSSTPQPRREIAHVAMFNPEPASVVAGRRFLYDASLTSSHGDSACASCHIFGDFDSLALGPRQSRRDDVLAQPEPVHRRPAAARPQSATSTR